MSGSSSQSGGTPAAELLAGALSGRKARVAEFSAVVYDELRRRARRLVGSARGAVCVQPTELVHDVFVKLMAGAEVDWNGRTHFVAVASRQLRHVLVDHVRAERAAKRGGEVRLTTLDAQVAAADRHGALDLLVLEDALLRLERANARRCAVVVLRLFGGLTVDEVAHYLQISPTAVKNHWRVAKAWLLTELDEPDGTGRAPA